MTSIELFQEAEKHLQSRRDDEAQEIYLRLADQTELSHLACYRLGEIYNRQGDPVRSNEFHFKAFQQKPDLANEIVPRDHPSYAYVYRAVNETKVTQCPLCKGPGTPYSCYNAMTNNDFIHAFNPIRVWMHCRVCHHLFAYNYPTHLGHVLSTSTTHLIHLNPKTQFLSTYSDLFSKILKHAPGYRLLEIGVGAGEMTAVALEFLFNVTGVDIRPAYAEAVSRMLEIPVYAADFLALQTDQLYDVVCMGDVIEHLEDPSRAISKVNQLLVANGVLWISTPNFESGYSRITKDQDPMWRVVEHLNYFSFRSLFQLLDSHGFRVVDYGVSSHYNGSMNVIAVKGR